MKSNRTITGATASGVVGLLVLALAGCAQPEPLDLSEACAKTTEQDGATVCTALHDEDPALKLPEGTADSPVGALLAGGESFRTVSGKSIPLTDDAISQIDGDLDYASLVYRATVTGDKVTKLEPVLKVSEDALLTRVFGGKTLVGKISVPTTPGSYNLEPTAPVIIRMGAEARKGTLDGAILNVGSGIVAPDGSCVAALPTGAENPLQGIFTSTVTLQRFPSMHLPFDDEMVLAWNDSSSGMGREFYPSVASLFGGEELEKTWRVTPHAAPDSAPSLEVTLDAALDTPATC